MRQQQQTLHCFCSWNEKTTTGLRGCFNKAHTLGHRAVHITHTQEPAEEPVQPLTWSPLMSCCPPTQPAHNPPAELPMQQCLHTCPPCPKLFCPHEVGRASPCSSLQQGNKGEEQEEGAASEDTEESRSHCQQQHCTRAPQGPHLAVQPALQSSRTGLCSGQGHQHDAISPQRQAAALPQSRTACLLSLNTCMSPKEHSKPVTPQSLPHPQHTDLLKHKVPSVHFYYGCCSVSSCFSFKHRDLTAWILTILSPR